MFMDGKLAFQATYGHLFAGGYIAETWVPAPTKIGPMSSSG